MAMTTTVVTLDRPKVVTIDIWSNDDTSDLTLRFRNDFTATITQRLSLDREDPSDENDVLRLSDVPTRFRYICNMLDSYCGSIYGVCLSDVFFFSAERDFAASNNRNMILETGDHEVIIVPEGWDTSMVPPSTEAEFQKEGEQWTLKYPGRDVPVASPCVADLRAAFRDAGGELDQEAIISRNTQPISYDDCETLSEGETFWLTLFEKSSPAPWA